MCQVRPHARALRCDRTPTSQPVDLGMQSKRETHTHSTMAYNNDFIVRHVHERACPPMLLAVRSNNDGNTAQMFLLALVALVAEVYCMFVHLLCSCEPPTQRAARTTATGGALLFVTHTHCSIPQCAHCLLWFNRKTLCNAQRACRI